MTDKVNHPSHYTSGPKCTCGRTIECIDVARGLGFTRGNAVKYLWRAGLKDSSPCVEDLRKAVWYIEDEINRLESEKGPAAKTLFTTVEGTHGGIHGFLPPTIGPFRGIEREKP